MRKVRDVNVWARGEVGANFGLGDLDIGSEEVLVLGTQCYGRHCAF